MIKKTYEFFTAFSMPILLSFIFVDYIFIVRYAKRFITFLVKNKTADSELMVQYISNAALLQNFVITFVSCFFVLICKEFFKKSSVQAVEKLSFIFSFTLIVCIVIYSIINNFA